ncbi:MAG: hypothetical protein RQ741_02805 [Wenzhouxiangellaceae bacterium]|nr:hypothetical protein [Wenzhouxiangellaceae bacterium]
MPLLAELLAPEGRMARSVWLDFGQPQRGLVEQLQKLRARLLAACLTDESGLLVEDWCRVESGLAKNFWSEPVDRILCWDLLNYMTPAELGRLSELMIRRAAPGCRVHAMIHYSERDMPAAPAVYRLQDGLELQFKASATDRIPAPRYSPKALEKSMPGLRVERTLLLNNGMQEYLFSII